MQTLHITSVLSVAAVELDGKIPRGEASKIAESLGISAPFLSKLRGGKILPNDAIRAKIAERFPEVAEGLWDVPHGLLAAVPQGPPPEPTPELALTTAEWLANELQTAQRAFVTLPDGAAKIRMAGQLADIILSLGKLTGAGSALTPRQIQQSAAWLQMQRVISDALIPYPDAAKAVSDSLKALGHEVTI